MLSASFIIYVDVCSGTISKIIYFSFCFFFVYLTFVCRRRQESKAHIAPSPLIKWFCRFASRCMNSKRILKSNCQIKWNKNELEERILCALLKFNDLFIISTVVLFFFFVYTFGMFNEEWEETQKNACLYIHSHIGQLSSISFWYFIFLCVCFSRSLSFENRF